MKQVAELKKKEAIRDHKEKKDKSYREKLREDQVHKDHRAEDAKKKAIREQLSRTSYHSQYGMQDQSKTSGQSVSQSNGQSKKGPPPAKRNKFGDNRSNPAGTPQNNYSNVQGPYGGKPYGYPGPPSHSVTKKSTGLSNHTKVKMSYVTCEQGPGGINKSHDRKIASAPQYPPP